MTRNERKLLIQTIRLGLLLTLAVIVLDGFGVLDPLERYLYDFRARDCQFFTPPPTDRVVHLDIDDPSLAEIGAFPWKRTKLAKMIDEIRLAGAKQISLDILFAEPQEPEYKKGSDVAIDHDANFAAAIKRANNVLLPISVDMEAAEASPVYTAVYQSLLKDLELSEGEIVAQLRGGLLDKAALPGGVHEAFASALYAAMFVRISDALAEKEMDQAHLVALLLPRAAAVGKRTAALLALKRAEASARSVRIIAQRTLPMPAGLPPLLTADAERAITIPLLTEAAAFSTFTDFLPDRDGIVRRVPLVINYRGRLFPHQALVIACTQLGVNIQNIRCFPDKIILPLPDNREIKIPVSTYHSREYGTVGMFMNIPWFGGKNWLTMYDTVAHEQPVQHLPLKNVWAISQLEEDIANNEREADAALFSVVNTFPSDKATAFVSKPPAERTSTERWPAIDEALQQMDSLMDPSLLSAKFEELKKDEQEFVASYRALKQVKRVNEERLTEIQSARAELQNELAGRTVIVGWTSTGKTDFYPTSLHPICPGVAILGVIVNGVITGDMWRAAPWWTTAAITLFVGLLVTCSVAYLEPKKAMLCTVGVMVVYALINGLILFDWANQIFGAAAPLTAAVLVWATLTVVRFISETSQRRKITARFQSYVDPQLVNYVLENIDSGVLEGQVKVMTVVFTDLAGFTTISEKLRERTVPLLNRYTSLMLPIIRENNGLWNKFLGDGIMFFFNAPQDNPQHARDAIRTVLEMQQALIGFNKELAEQGLPAVAMRAGISSGPMIVGDAGSTDLKHAASDYTVLGDEVNLGARLESANKAMGSKMLMNDYAAQLCGDEFLLRPMGNICVVGKTQGVMCHEPLCRFADATEDQKRFARFSQRIVDSFGLSDFSECLKATEEMKAAFGRSKFTELYSHLAQLYLVEPPGETFDGQIVLSEK